MTKVFLDTNIILDLLASRSPYDISARLIFDWAEQNKLELYVSALSNEMIIVTRNTADFSNSILPVMTSIDFVNFFERT